MRYTRRDHRRNEDMAKELSLENYIVEVHVVCHTLALGCRPTTKCLIDSEPSAVPKWQWTRLLLLVDITAIITDDTGSC